MMNSLKVSKNLAEEDRREKALKKERKAVKKWKWTTAHSEQSFRKEEKNFRNEEKNFRNEEQSFKNPGLFKGVDLDSISVHHQDGGFFLYFRVKYKSRYIHEKRSCVAVMAFLAKKLAENLA